MSDGCEVCGDDPAFKDGLCTACWEDENCPAEGDIY